VIASYGIEKTSNRLGRLTWLNKIRAMKKIVILTAFIERPERLVYLSSGMHYGTGPHLEAQTGCQVECAGTWIGPGPARAVPVRPAI
jgi:hypothetical protein